MKFFIFLALAVSSTSALSALGRRLTVTTGKHCLLDEALDRCTYDGNMGLLSQAKRPEYTIRVTSQNSFDTLLPLFNMLYSNPASDMFSGKFLADQTGDFEITSPDSWQHTNMQGEWGEMIDLYVSKAQVDTVNGCYMYKAKVNFTNPVHVDIPEGNFVTLTFNVYAAMHEDENGMVSLFWAQSKCRLRDTSLPMDGVDAGKKKKQIQSSMCVYATERYSERNAALNQCLGQTIIDQGDLTECKERLAK